jgi:hypothetical protein
VKRRRLVEFGGGDEGVEGGDGFDQTGNSEGIADAPRFTDEVERTAFAAEGDGHADK